MIWLPPATVIPTVPLASSVTSGEFWPEPPASVPTIWPVGPSKMSTPLEVGTRMSWAPEPVRSAVTTDPPDPKTGWCQMGWPVDPFRTQTEVPVLSTTWSWPLPMTSASAGLDMVVLSSVSAHRRWQPESTAISWLVLDAPE